jgi:glutamate synthase domain-containing protein 3
MAQRGRLVVRGDAGDALGDSIYEARIYLRGTAKSLGADCVEKPMEAEHIEELAGLLKAAGFTGDDPASYKRYGSARTLYHFTHDNEY